MTLTLDEVEHVIEMALQSHAAETKNYLEHVNSLIIAPPAGSALFPDEDEQKAMTVTKGLCTAQMLMNRIRGLEQVQERSWLTSFLAGYSYERHGHELAEFLNLDPGPLTADFKQSGFFDLEPAVCAKVMETLGEKIPNVSDSSSGAHMGLVASWVVGRRIGQYVSDGEVAAAIFAASEVTDE